MFCNHGGIGMVRTQIQLSEDQAKAVKAVAAAQGISAAEVIRRAIDSVIQSPSMPDAVEKRKRALEVIGKFRSGEKDISEKHDDYLAEAFLQ
jgi:hypothetical protein